MDNKELLENIKSMIASLEADIDKHQEYLDAPLSLEYNHYVVVVKPKTGISLEHYLDWTIRVTCYGPVLQKNTKASDYFIFTNQPEARAAARKLRLVDMNGTRMEHESEIMPCRTWHRKMIEYRKSTIETFRQIINNMTLAA